MRLIHDGRTGGRHALLGAPHVALALLACVPGASRAQQQTQGSEASAGPLQEVIVTATRRAESLSKVPISVTALTQESLDERGVKDFSEVARFTPGVNFDNSGTNNISIRGISGSGGAGTTGIYLDDTPIQMRALAFNPDEALPKSFDIERVEVLRGPQGTLFGAGSEGGTVRYITTQPSLTKTSTYGRSEFSSTQYGDPSYEAGAAIGGPPVPGGLGAAFRVIDRPRREQTGYEGTLYNLGFYQTFMGDCPVGGTGCLLDNTGVHLPAGATDYRSPATVDNGQQNITQEIRLQSADPNARLLWTTGVFFAENRQSYLEQIHDPQLQELVTALMPGSTIVDVFGVGYDSASGFPTDSYFLKTNAKDEQYALFGELSYGLTDRLKGTLGARFSRTKYSFDTLTGGPQLFASTAPGTGSNQENAFTPRVGLQFQRDPNDMYYFTYAKGFRPGGANNPLPPVACQQDFIDFGITAAPTTFSSDSVNSFEVGAKNNIANRVKIASSIYYIRWNNIQQTVVPPTCQISFIDNLGQAVAKGADLQAEIALTERFTVELAAGYTDARYTRDSSLSSNSTTGPVVANGDAITSVASELGGGQPTAPVTVIAGLEYKFSAFSHATFVRADAEYYARAKWPTPGQDPTTLQSDAAAFVVPGTTRASVRGGVDFGSWQLAAFVDNLTNAHPLTDYNYTICPPPAQPACPGSDRLQRAYTFRPRTFGLTAIFRQ